MNRKKPYAVMLTAIYITVIILTVLAFTIMGFSVNHQRLLITLLAILIAETAVYAYTLFWIKVARTVSGTPPVVLSGAFITAAYTAAVVLAAVIFDWLLEVPSFWYAAVHLLLLAAAAISLALIGLYGWHAGAQERKEGRAARSLLGQRKKLAEIKQAARGWEHEGNDQLVGVVRRVEEKFTYSDPVSRPELSATEEMLDQQIALLRDQVELLLATSAPRAGWEDELEAIATDIETTLQRRNRELAGLK